MRRSLLVMFVAGAFVAASAHADVVVGSFDSPATARAFSDAAQGDIAPVRTIGGPQSQLQNVTSFAFDPLRGEIFVGDFNGQAIRVFDARASGDRPATRTITSGSLGQPRELALDLVHDELFAITQLSTVSTYPRGADGSTFFARRITWGGLPGSLTRIDNPSGLAYLPAQDQLALGDFESLPGGGFGAEILFFARTADGNVAPARALRGALTQLGSFVESLAVDPVRNELYAIGIVQGTPQVRRIVVFSGDAAGNVAPLRVIEGPATQVEGQSQLAYDPRAERIWVATNGDRLVAFPRLATGDATPVRVITGPLTGIATAFGVAVVDLDSVFASGFE